MDEVERIISRLNGMDPERPYFDPLVAEEAIQQHARLIGFRNVSIAWAMGPRQANVELEGVDFNSPESRLWARTTQAMRDQAMATLQSDATVLEAFRDAQDVAAQRLADALHLERFVLAIRNLFSGDVGARGYNVASLVTSVLTDVVASESANAGALEDLNEAYLPFADAMMAGLGSFWVVGERFVCLPLPRLIPDDDPEAGAGQPAAVWPNGEAYAYRDGGLVPVLQSVEW